MTKVLGKEDLLSANELLKRELYQIPGTEAAVWVREMTTDHMLQFKRIAENLRAGGVKETTPEQDVEIMTAVISFSVCDENGNLLFETPEEAKGLTRNNFELLTNMGNKALTLSGIKVVNGQPSSEATDNLPNDLAKSLLESSPRNSRKRAGKS
jgi:hypothetical protein